jgi:hypothetical protein
MSSFETLQARPPNPPDSITHPDGGVAAGQSGETLQRRTRKNLVPSSAQIHSVDAARRPLRGFPAKAGIHLCRGHRLSPV